MKMFKDKDGKHHAFVHPNKLTEANRLGGEIGDLTDRLARTSETSDDEAKVIRRGRHNRPGRS